MHVQVILFSPNRWKSDEKEFTVPLEPLHLPPPRMCVPT